MYFVFCFTCIVSGALTLLLRAQSQQLSAVKYGDLYAWLSSGIHDYRGRRLGTFFSCFRGIISSKSSVNISLMLRADLQQWSVNYGDSYVWFSNGNPFQRFLRLQALHQLMFTNETRCLLWAVWLWNFDQAIQFEILCPLWLRINESAGGDSIFEPPWWGCICNSVDGDSVFGTPIYGGVMFATLSMQMVTVSLNPDGGAVFATLSMVTVSLNPDGGVVFITLLLNLSMVTAFINPDGGVVFATLLYGENMLYTCRL